MDARLRPKKQGLNHENNSESITTNPRKRKEDNKNSEFEFCKVCKRNHDQGQRHKYFPSHTKALADFLSRFQSKINDISFFLKNPSILRPELSSRNRFWCVFCDSDIDELGSSFACANAINHLASSDHLKNLKHFLWKYGGGADRVDSFRILEADVNKWEKKCKSLKNEAASCGEGCSELPVGHSNDIHNECHFENKNYFETNTNHLLNSNITNGVIPLQYNTNEYQVSHSENYGVTNFGSNMHSVPSFCLGVRSSTASQAHRWSSNNLIGMSCASDVYRSENGSDKSSQEYSQSTLLTERKGSAVVEGHVDAYVAALRLCRNFITQICQVYQDEVVNREIRDQGLQKLTPVTSLAIHGGGNVHSGAPAPWLDAADGNQLKSVLNSTVSSSSKSKKSKLNPKRVGAAWAEKRKIEMEMEKRGEIVRSEYDPNWLPNFGRVWQSGTRKESRKEFQIEKPKQPNVEIHSEMPIKIQPYVSKRVRKDASKDSGDPDGNT